MSQNTESILDMLDADQDAGLANRPDTSVTPEDSGTEAGKYRNVTAQYTEAQAPEGLLTSIQFAGRLTRRNFVEREMPDAEGYVNPTNVNNAMTAVRHPLPVVLVDGRPFLEWEAASAAWDARPVRGEGGARSSGTLDDENLLRLTYEAREKMDRLRERQAKIQSDLEAQARRLAKRENQALARFGDDLEDKLATYGREQEDKAAAAEEALPDDGDAE